jgi:hypothetical protein
MIVIVTTGRGWTWEGKKRYYDISVVMAEVVDWQLPRKRIVSLGKRDVKFNL